MNRYRKPFFFFRTHACPAMPTTHSESGFSERADFPGHFGYDGIAFQVARDGALVPRYFTGQHDFEAGHRAISEQPYVNANHPGNRQQLFVVVGKDGIDVSLGWRRSRFGHLLVATARKG